jgi:tRNA A37 threonylcarbamoyladenosine synthetase subunit TsaC/SUA5/YrdC
LASSSAQPVGMPQITQNIDLDMCDVDLVSVLIAAGDLASGSGSTIIDCSGGEPKILREGALAPEGLIEFINSHELTRD